MINTACCYFNCRSLSSSRSKRVFLFIYFQHQKGGLHAGKEAIFGVGDLAFPTRNVLDDNDTLYYFSYLDPEAFEDTN